MNSPAVIEDAVNVADTFSTSQGSKITLSIYTSSLATSIISGHVKQLLST